MTRDYQITIGFSTTDLFISRFIRWITDSACSHAFIAFTDHALNMRMVMQAESWGFELRPWKRWLKNNTLVAEFEPVAGDLEEALLYLANSLGTKFDYRSALYIGLRSKFRLWKKSRFTLNPNFSPTKLTCAEAVTRFLQRGGYRAVAGLNPEITGPDLLLQKVLQGKDEFQPVYINRSFLKYDSTIRQKQGMPEEPEHQDLKR